MPRLTKSLPKYRKHKASGQAIVTLATIDHYLGPYGTQTSRKEYDRLVAEWQLNGRRLLPQTVAEFTINELLAAYWRFAKDYYTKDGTPTAEIAAINGAFSVLRRLYGAQELSEFGPLALKTVREEFIKKGLCRGYVNQSVGRIKRAFKWGVENEVVPVTVYQALATVAGLRKGKTEARETVPILPIGEETVDRTLPMLSLIVADMVRFQLLTGCRPVEVCIIRPCDIDTSGNVWFYPGSHKTEHHDKDRIVAIGPMGQEILRPDLLRAREAYCFSPADSERQRRRQRHEQRATPLSYGNRPGINRKRRPKRKAGEQYTTASYRRAIHRTCDKAFPPAVE